MPEDAIFYKNVYFILKSFQFVAIMERLLQICMVMHARVVVYRRDTYRQFHVM
jgi:hypothetical protein